MSEVSVEYFMRKIKAMEQFIASNSDDCCSVCIHKKTFYDDCIDDDGDILFCKDCTKDDCKCKNCMGHAVSNNFEWDDRLNVRVKLHG